MCDPGTGARQEPEERGRRTTACCSTYRHATRARQRTSEAEELMLAVWYERQGPADEVLQFGDLPDPEPGPAEVRVRLTRSGVNPGDTKKRGDWLGYGMPFPRIIPHSDGAGVIDAVGAGVHQGRIGRRVWVFGAQSYRPFGTAAQLTVVPADQAVDLPDDVSDDVGACLGIPGITAHRALFADGPVTGMTVLVHAYSAPSAPWRRSWRAGAARPSSARSDDTTTCSR
jgi:D-arabinose 1-dehydrogenase-like Zn-dependent alcohol dehydrogenase